MQRILVLGGYGAFGARVAQRLAHQPDVEVMIAGRSRERALDAAMDLEIAGGTKVTAQRLDAAEITASDLAALRPAALINACGPYQRQDYRVARACVSAGVHYLDLADARTFVTGIRALDKEARDAGVLIVSGASTVPAVSGAVLDAHAPQFASMCSVVTVIAPGNSFDPGLATTQSILSALGRPLVATGGRKPVYGWQGLERRTVPGLGVRWTSHCDAPDLDLFPSRYLGLGTVAVRAALEVGTFHIGLWGLSWLVRAGVLANPQRLAGPLLAAKRRLGFLGSDRSGMLVTLEGLGQDGSPRKIDWSLVAGNGHGPYVPVAPAVLLAKQLLSGALQIRGAMPCLGLFTLADFLAEIADLDIGAGAA